MSSYEEQVEASQQEAEDNQQVADAGVPGQILYPEREVDAERAAGFAAGKYDTLYEEEDDDNGTGHSRSGWQNPADRPSEEQKQEEEETEPEGSQ